MQMCIELLYLISHLTTEITVDHPHDESESPPAGHFDTENLGSNLIY